MERLKAIVDNWQSNQPAGRAITPRAPDPSRQLTNVYYALRQYGFFADGKDPNYGAEEDVGEPAEINADALEALKTSFLAKFPDFESGGGFPGASGYHPEEDEYKRTLIAKVHDLLAESPLDTTALGDAAERTLAGVRAWDYGWQTGGQYGAGSVYGHDNRYTRIWIAHRRSGRGDRIPND